MVDSQGVTIKTLSVSPSGATVEVTLQTSPSSSPSSTPSPSNAPPVITLNQKNYSATAGQPITFTFTVSGDESNTFL